MPNDVDDGWPNWSEQDRPRCIRCGVNDAPFGHTRCPECQELVNADREHIPTPAAYRIEVFAERNADTIATIIAREHEYDDE